MPPGWYPDPTTGQQRWWDGQQWGAYAAAPQDAYGPPPAAYGPPPPVAGYGAPPPQQGAYPGYPPQQQQGYPQQQGLAAQAQGYLDPAAAQSRSNAALAHYLGLMGFIGPAIIMGTSGARDPFVRAHAVEALNFHLTVLIGWLIVGVINMVTCGLAFPLILGVIIPVIIFGIQGGSAASRGEHYRYPWTIRMVT